MDDVVSIACNVHTTLHIKRRHAALTHTDVFQRTMDLYQLSVVFYLFPCATHRRYAHMLGTYHLAASMCRVLSSMYDIEEEVCDAVAVAALLHDVGHGPFSHEFEAICKALGIPFDHEEQSCKLIDYLRETEPEITAAALTDKQWEWVQCIIRGNVHEDLEPWTSEVVHNKLCEMDVDKFDYLARDMVALGMNAFGRSNVERLVNNARIHDGHLAWRTSVYGDVVSLFDARLKLHQSVCMHRTALAAKMLLTDLIKASPELQATIRAAVVDVREFLKLDDTMIKQYLRTTAETGRPRALAHDFVYKRKVCPCIGFIATRAVLSPSAASKLASMREIRLETAPLQFGKGPTHVMERVPFLGGGGKLADNVVLMSGTPMPSGEIVFKHYVFLVDPTADVEALQCALSRVRGVSFAPRGIE